MSKRSKARWKAYRRKHEKAKLRLVAVTPSLMSAWTAPVVRELSGVEAIIRRANMFELDRFERMARNARALGMTVPAIDAWDGRDFGPATPAPVELARAA